MESKEEMTVKLSQLVSAQALGTVTEAAAKTTTIYIDTNAALYKRADALGLGELKTDEVYFRTDDKLYVAQGYTDGILYCEVGHYADDDIMQVGWA